MATIHSLAVSALLLGLAFSGCSEGVGPRPDYDPGVTAADFVEGIDNEWLPLKPGAWWLYEFEEDGERGTVNVTVTGETRTIMGVQATVVRDTETIGGELAEDTWDWFAQDKDGNVWYLGEDTCEYEGGECVDTGGAWEWGKDGALPGIVMWANPTVNGTWYYQEFYWGEATDKAEVLGFGRAIEVPAGTFTDTLTTKEWNPLEKGSAEHAHYARGVGTIQKQDAAEGDEGEVLVDSFVPA